MPKMNHPDKTQGHKRSGKWPKVRKEFLKNNPVCAVCGGNKKLEVHHVVPYHIAPKKELDTNNLITLCENYKDGVNCHLFVAHLGNYRSFNVNVIEDAKIWSEKIKNRPKDGYGE